MPTEWDGHRKEGRRSIALETHAFTMRGGPLRAFGYGQFRIFWMASFVSQVSFAMVLITRGWLVLELTDSPFLVTAVTATALLPPSLAAPFTGVMADRLNRRTILIM